MDNLDNRTRKASNRHRLEAFIGLVFGGGVGYGAYKGAESVGAVSAAEKVANKFGFEQSQQIK